MINSKIRIGIDGHILEEKVTGAGKYLINLLKEFSESQNAKDNFEFYIYSKRKIPEFGFLNSPLFFRRTLTFLGRPSFLGYFLVLLPLWSKKDKIDVFFFPFGIAPPSFYGKSAVTILDLSYFSQPKRFSLKYRLSYQIFTWYAALHSKSVITISEFSKKEIEKYLKVQEDKLKVIYLGVDARFKKIEDIEVLKKTKAKYGIQNNFIFYLGLIFNRRYVAQAILAFERIAKDFPGLQFLIVGKNKTHPFININELIAKANKNLGYQAIIKKDYIEDDAEVVLLYSAALFSVYLSDYEGFGLPLAEAMACGTPVISTNLTSLGEIGGGHQFVVKNPGDIDEIALKMRQLILNQDLRQKLSKEGIGYVKKFNWKNCAEETLEILRKTASHD